MISLLIITLIPICYVCIGFFISGLIGLENNRPIDFVDIIVTAMFWPIIWILPLTKFAYKLGNNTCECIKCKYILWKHKKEKEDVVG